VAVWRGGAPLPATGSAIDRADNWMLGGTLGDYVGDFLAVVGDTDGDGFPELAVGASQKSSNAGAVYLLQGRDAMYGELSSAQVTYTGAANNRLGRGIASDVDLDGDGNADIVMMGANASGYNTVFLDYGDTSRGTVATSALDAQLSTDGTEFAFFRNAPVGGDFDGDGLDDLIVSDGSADYGGTNTGAVWALWGSPTRYSGARDIETVATVVAAGSSSGEVGWATQPGGDWDGDGDDELWLFTSGVGLYVIPGGSDRRASFTPSSAALVTYAWDASDMDAESIRQVGDWTGDGVNEVLVFLEDTGSNTGVNWLYSSEVRSGTLDAEEHRIGDLTGSTDHTNGNAGYGIAPVPGDLDGDGDLDQLLGDPNFDTNQGQIYVIRNTLIEE
jgi:hypothetical protein